MKSLCNLRPGAAVSAWLMPLLAGSLAGQTQFAQEAVLATSPPAVLGRMVVGDFDGDGDLDLFAQALLVTPFSAFVLLQNDGRGRFENVSAAALPVFTTGGSLGTIGLVTLDIDGDGRLDIFAGDTGYPGASLLLHNVGGGVFADQSTSLPPGLDGVIDALARDFDGDGDVDLLTIQSVFAGGELRLLVNDGSGSFAVALAMPTAFASRMAATDIDGDGDIDFAIGEQAGIRLVRNDGGLVFTDVSASQLPPLAGSGAMAPWFGDLDGDGDDDLLVTRSGGPVDEVLLNVAGTFVPAGVTMSTSGTLAAALIDIDDDGDLDLIRGQVVGSLVLELNSGAASFVPAPSRLPGLPTAAPTVVTGDLDGDEDEDVVLANYLVGGTSLLRNRHRHLAAGAAVLGQTWTIDVWSTPGYATLDHLGRLGVGLVRLPQPLLVPGFGALWLELAAPLVAVDAVVPAAAGVRGYSFAIPSIPALIGIELHVQALLEQAPQPAHFTGFDSVVIQ